MAKKKAKKKLGALYQPAQHLSGRTLRSAAQALTDLEFAPQERALKSMAANATAQGTKLASNAGDYYTQMAESEKTRLDRQSALRGMVNTRTAAVGADVQAANTAATDQEKARLAQDTLFRGNMGQSDTVLSELAALGARSQAKQSQAASLVDAQGANYEDLAAAMASARQLRGGEVQDRLLNRMANERTKIRDQRAGLAADKGNARTKNLLTLRQSSFENALTQGELGVKQGQLEATMAGIKSREEQAAAKRRQDARENARDRSLQREKIRAEEERLGRTLSSKEKLAILASETSRSNNVRTNATSRRNTKDRIAASGGSGGVKELADGRRARNTITLMHDDVIALNEGTDSSATALGRLRGVKDPKKRRRVVANILKSRSGGEVPEYQISAALDLYFDGHLSGATKRMLKDNGIDPSKLRPRKTRAPQAPSWANKRPSRG